jgi:hypothetical protein
MGTIIVIIFYAILFRETDLSSILEELALAIDRTTTYQRVNVVRSKVLDGARRALARASFKDEVPMYVAFAGEFGIDTGGPFREFCRLASEGLATSRIFWGPADYKNLQLSFDGSPAVYEAELPFY